MMVQVSTSEYVNDGPKQIISIRIVCQPKGSTDESGLVVWVEEVNNVFVD